MSDRSSWGKTYADLWRHPKWVQLDPGPRALWVTALSWTVESRTFGSIPTPMLMMFRATAEDAAALVEAGLWEEAEGGYQMHDWDDHQTSRERFESTSRRRAEAGRKGGKARHAKRSENVTTSDVKQVARQVAKQTASNSQAEVEVEVEEQLTPPTPQGELLSVPERPRSPKAFVYPDAFERLWRAWPKPGDNKRPAFTAWERATRGTSRRAPRVTAEDLQAAVERYAADPNLPPAQYIPAASAWINQDRWENGPLPPRGGPSGRPQAGDTHRAMQRSHSAAQKYRALEDSGYYDQQTPPQAPRLVRRTA